MSAVVTLKKGEGRTLKAGGLWVYDNEIASIAGTFENGDLVEIHDFDGFAMGRGFINLSSKIRIRLMTRKPGQTIDEDFIRMRVQNAWNYRKHTVETDSCRLIFGEADFLPGIVIDKFADVLVVESLALGIDRMKETIIKAVKEVLAADGISIRGVYERSDAKVREQEGLPRQKGFLGAAFDTNVPIEENGVLAADASQSGIARAQLNAKLNGLEEQVQFICQDVFELLPELERAGRQFDVVILDPPAFTKSRNSVKNAVKGYREINLRGMKLVRDGGFLATCSCSHFMSYELFAQTIQQAARSAHKRLRQAEFRTQSPDHPILWAAQESYYLKFYIFQVCEER